MKVLEFGRPCLTNAHLAFGSKGDARSEPGMTERPKNLWILEPFPFHLLLNEASTVQEPLNVGQTVAFLAADG